MIGERDPRIRRLIVELAGSSPEAPTFAEIEDFAAEPVGEGQFRPLRDIRPKADRGWLVALTAGVAVVVLVGGVALLFGGSETGNVGSGPTPSATVAPTADEEPPPEADAPVNVEPAIEAGAISTAVSATISGPVVEPAVVPVPGEYSPWVETRLAASDAVIGDWFGWSVAVDDDRIVVGAPFTNIGGDEYAGAVYVFEADGNGGWAETRLTASDSSDGGQFGMAVAIEGDRVVIGRPFDENPRWAGSVYVFDRNSDGAWIETKLTAADGAGGDAFGSSVAVDGDRIVVGAGGVNGDTGSVYVFEPDGDGEWAGTKLAASDGQPRTFFGLMADGPRGMPVAADGGRIVVGSRSLSAESTVYVYEPDGAGGWIETRLAEFGFGVDIDGDRVVISDESAVHIFDPDGNGGWTQTEVMISDRAPGDRVLQMTQSTYSPVATANGRVVFASFPIDTEVIVEPPSLRPMDPAERMGPVYIFDPDGDNEWAETILDVSSNNQIIGFVFAVAADGDRVVVGATGVIYVYEHIQN
jgi:hypothetical protein